MLVSLRCTGFEERIGTHHALKAHCERKTGDDSCEYTTTYHLAGSFMDYDLGYFDLETRELEPLENRFSPIVLPMQPVTVL